MAIFWRLLGFLRPYKPGVWGSLLLAAAATGVGVLIPALTGVVVTAIEDGNSERVTQVGLFILAAAVIRWVLSVLRRLVAGRVSLGVEYDLRQGVYTHLQSLEMGFFDHQQTGQLMSRATVDLQSVRFFLGYGLIFITQSALTIVFTAVAMFVIDPMLAAISLFPVPFVVWIAQRYGMVARPAQQEVQQRLAETTAEAEETIGGVRVVRAFAREDRQEARFEYAVGRVFEQSMYATRLRAFYQPLIGFLPQLGLALLLVVGGTQVINGSMSLGHFTAFYTYLVTLLGPMRMLGMALGMAQRAVASGARLFEILDRAPSIASDDGAGPLPEGAGRVELRGVTLDYDTETDAPTALRGVDLTVEAGTTLALVGGTGSGKTSLVSLLPRLYDPTKGAVLIDGADVRHVQLEALRSEIAVVDDDPFLFSASVRENIAYAKPDATDEQIEHAARRAQAHDFITRMAEGYATRVGERGQTLSGGQRQRIAIARALLAEPRILVLDDATSAVDASTEQQIKLALREAMAGRTTFIIAHRLSTIALADEIAVLEHGELVCHGTHDELLEHNQLYRDIVEKGLPDQVFLNRNPAEREAAL
ncbi:MAG: ABC transporter ATP-binding protein [Solirubrobacteraceae bacterium]|nr:ABC transporter ATP-binding protein [Solirubrobacteraceae bacterium]